MDHQQISCSAAAEGKYLHLHPAGVYVGVIEVVNSFLSLINALEADKAKLPGSPIPARSHYSQEWRGTKMTLELQVVFRIKRNAFGQGYNPCPVQNWQKGSTII